MQVAALSLLDEGVRPAYGNAKERGRTGGGK